jgi:glycosyltransferase involved in cell wall biosynthesis
MNRNLTVAIVAPSPLPYGGMALQAEKLCNKLRSSDVDALFIKSNAEFPQVIKFLNEIKGLRTVIRFMFFACSLLRLRRAAVVHIFGASHEYFFFVVMPTILMARMMKKKIILNYRGGEAEDFLKKWGFIAVPLIKTADVIAVPSLFLKEIIEKATGETVMILPNLIDMDIFTYRERAELKPAIIVSRQLEPRYNIECALRAFNIVKKKYPEAQLMIAGAGSEETRLNKLQQEMGLKDVNFLGALSHAELFAIYERCDIMINPTNADNFPGSILEAFACGIPVVTTRVGGIPYMVTQGETGFMVDADDHQGIARGVSTLLQNPDIARSLSRNGRRVADKYEWEEIRQTVLNMYSNDIHV